MAEKVSVFAQISPTVYMGLVENYKNFDTISSIASRA